MTREQAREAAQVMLGWADGKEVQHKPKPESIWWDYMERSEPSWDWRDFHFRLKPTPVLRPWTADEVPLGAWMRSKCAHEHRWLIVDVYHDSIRAQWFDNNEHSTDGGLTWKPCGVEEVGK